MKIVLGLLIPMIGTTLGAAGVFFIREQLRPELQKFLLGFAAGVMTAASVWSLLIPAIEMESKLGRWSFVPAALGFFCGTAFLTAMDLVIPRFLGGGDLCEQSADGKNRMKKTAKLVMAVTLHNIPEGLSSGAVFAGVLSGNTGVTLAGAFGLAAGIAVQNAPEGLIVALPVRKEGAGTWKAFFCGTLSGIVEPIAGGITIFLAAFINPLLPWLLAFAAGAMINVAVEELIPEAAQGEGEKLGSAGFVIGFLLMMILDVALG